MNNSIKHCFQLVFIFFLLFVFLLNPAKTHAQEYKIRPIIAVPTDMTSSYSKEIVQSRFFSAVEQALGDVKDFYQKQMNGKTFKTEKPEVVLLEGNITIHKNETNLCNLFTKLGGYKIIQPDTYTIPVVWIVGSGNGIRCTEATQSVKNTDIDSDFDLHVVVLQFADLLNIEKDGKQEEISLSVLAHELGHAFGLLDAGWAKEHTCSIASPQDCKPGAPQPLPGRNEGLTDIMFSSVVQNRSFKESVFHNTVYNPEISKLYQSPFLNVEKDAPPEPIQSTEKVVPFIRKLSSETLKEGMKVEIVGNDFGEVKGKVNFFNDNYLENSFSKITITEWKNTKIIFAIGDVPFGDVTSWNISVQNAAGVESSAINVSLIGNAALLTTTVQKVGFRVTCGEDKRDLAGVRVSVQNTNSKKIIGTKSNFGIQTLAFSPENGQTYSLAPDPIDAQQSSPISVALPDIANTIDTDLYVFHFATCPTKQLAILSSYQTIQSILVNAIDWEYLIHDSYTISLPGTLGSPETFHVPFMITYTDGRTAEMLVSFNYRPPVPTQEPDSSVSPVDPSDPTDERDGEVTLPSGEKAKTCHYREEFTGGFNGCDGEGIKKCKGVRDEENTCVYNPDVDPKCKVATCSDEDFVPEPTVPDTNNPEPTEAEKTPGACERDTFYGCANRCNDKGQPYEIFGCKDGTRKQHILNDSDGWEDSDCAKACNSTVCKSTYYYDDSVNSCIHKRPLESNPSECSFDPVEASFCGR